MEKGGSNKTTILYCYNVTCSRNYVISGILNVKIKLILLCRLGRNIYKFFLPDRIKNTYPEAFESIFCLSVQIVIADLCSGFFFAKLHYHIVRKKKKEKRKRKQGWHLYLNKMNIRMRAILCNRAITNTEYTKIRLCPAHNKTFQLIRNGFFFLNENIDYRLFAFIKFLRHDNNIRLI